MRHYWNIYKTFFKSSLLREMQFRANFFAKILQNCTWIVFSLVAISVIFGRVDSIAGWARGEIQILVGTLFLVSALVNLFTFAVMEIPQHVRQGTLDFIITKPVDTQFWVSVRKFNFAQLGSFTAGIITLIVSAVVAKMTITPLQIVLYIVSVLCGWTALYSFQMLLMTTGIYFVRVDNMWVLGETIVRLGEHPMEIFPLLFRQFLTYGIPVAFFAYVPAIQLTRGADFGLLLGSLVAASAMFLLSRLWWKFSLRHYSSASS
ncbi:MAG TPA: ABC-2 family transporter protein [Fimbriimonas sp.]|nr:ABC-2 family transporter protein [Fimbriimonas sp.]